MKLIIYYKNGNKIGQNIYWLDLTAKNKLAFIVKKNPHGVFQQIVTVPLENVQRFRVEEEEQEATK